MLVALARWSPVARQYIHGRDVVEPTSASLKPHRSAKWRWLVAAAVLGGALGLGAHILYGKQSGTVITELLNQDEAEQGAESGNEQGVKAQLP